MPASIRNSLSWILDAFERDPTYVPKRMFSMDAAYIDARLCITAGDRKEPWNGMLVCTSQDHHASLIEAMPALQVHPVIGKWLYVSQAHPEFESVVARVVSIVLARDPRIGVEPKPKGSRKAALPKD
ncbi:hypothetical protein C0Z18_19670 [Trinickia dabaoshanensis]|uniref:MmcQ/YjbR family DNA-binding protein n=1 Tax=Trinickia dabaoshanensis TaxID=564714 RepID=A0A2N7VKK7_9BURK|nr:hypothetical protein [Trinickia dabaoshanensis]PMS17676.1 hypothetical protein C0Z18_19670 [Trinickia dabaoshanensis]